jgi:hypothetical protein
MRMKRPIRIASVQAVEWENCLNESEKKSKEKNPTYIRNYYFQFLLKKIADDLETLKSKLVKEENCDKMILTKWKFAASVLDRLFFIMTLIYLILTLICIVLASKNFFNFQ